MHPDFASVQRDLMAEIARHGLAIAPDALKPLQKIDFQKLVHIHDHEEHFLRTVFADSLVRANRTRRDAESSQPEITAQDVRTAMLMLGTAVTAAAEAQFSSVNKSIIQSVCPYC